MCVCVRVCVRARVCKSKQAFMSVCEHMCTPVTCSCLCVCVPSLLPSIMMSVLPVNNNDNEKKSLFIIKQRWEATRGSYLHHKLCIHTLLLSVFV